MAEVLATTMGGITSTAIPRTPGMEVKQYTQYTQYTYILRSNISFNPCHHGMVPGFDSTWVQPKPICVLTGNPIGQQSAGAVL